MRTLKEIAMQLLEMYRAAEDARICGIETDVDKWRKRLATECADLQVQIEKASEKVA